MDIEDNFLKTVNINEKKSTETASNNSLIDEIIDEEDLLNLLTPNDVLDKIDMYDSTVEIIGYIENIEASRTICKNNESYKFFKFFINNGSGKKIQVVAWNDEVDRIEQLIRTNAIVHLDGVQARKPKNKIFNHGNVEFELLIQRGTIITPLGNYHSKLEQTEPHYVKLSEVMNTSQRIILEAYIKTNFITKYHHKLNKNIGCGSVSDGFYKLETHITNFNEKEYSALKFNKGDKVEVTGTMQNSSIPPYLIIDNIHDIKRKDGQMSLIQLYKATETFQKRKADDDERQSKRTSFNFNKKD